MEYFNLHTHQFTNKPDVIELVNQYPQEFVTTIPHYSIGVHPLYIDEIRFELDLQTINQKLELKECLALGECGLDKRSKTNFEIQQNVLEQQLILAQKHKKPVVIHCVSAFQELIDVKNKLKITVPMIIHGFSKKKELAQQMINNGFYLSFGKQLLQNSELETVFKLVPNNRFLLETDMLDESIQEVYKLAAQYKKIELKELKIIIWQNFNTIFKPEFVE